MSARFLATLLLLVGVFAISIAQPRGRNHMSSGPRHAALIEKLNLTDAQDTQWKNLRIELMKKQTQLRSKIQTLRLETQQAFLADKIDRNAIEKNIKAITHVQEQLKLNMIDHWFAVNNMLTPDQQKVWKQHAGAFGQNMRGDAMRPGMGRMFRERFDDPDED